MINQQNNPKYLNTIGNLISQPSNRKNTPTPSSLSMNSFLPITFPTPHFGNNHEYSNIENAYTSPFVANTGQLHPPGSHATGGITLRFELPRVMQDKIIKILN